MISRVAESCFWLNRYVERVEVMARMLHVNLAFQLDVALPEAERWRPLVVVNGQEADFLKRTKPEDVDDAETVQRYLTWSEDNPSGLYSSLRAARENARTIRETISLEMWETLNDLWVWMGGRAARRLYDSDRHSFYVHLRDGCLLFHGVAQATMLHEDPFEFMRLGTSVERADQTARVIDIKYHAVGEVEESEETAVEAAAEAAQWLATLRFCSGVEPFLKREDKPLSGRAVAEFLLFDPAFPRSVLHNLERTRNFLTLVRPPPPTHVGDRSLALVSDTLAELGRMKIDSVLERGLHEVATWIVETSADLGRAIHDDYFDPKGPAEFDPKGPAEQRARAEQAQTQSASGGGASQSQSQSVSPD